MSDDVRPAQPTDSVSRVPGEWEREVLEKLVFASLKEQRAKRRWTIFFRLVMLAIVAMIVLSVSGVLFGGSGSAPGPHTALIDVEGVIDAGGEASAEKINAALQAAFDEDAVKGVVLRINSPGGSPVQAGMIYDEIRRLRRQYPDKPVYAVVEEICASGGYYVAAAADKIFVNQASVVGSIGVIMEGFGFTGLMEKLGVERRLVVSGENKALLDPFSPRNPAQQAHAQALVDEIYKQFVAAVREGRGERLHETPDMFTGLIWTGAKSVELGLADELGTVDSVARDVIKADAVVDYTVRENFAERVAKRVGVAFGAGLAKTGLSRLWHWR
ncbi:signal peptide peptidase SppA [Pigmentiphaga sp.]|jgi:signal peptide peptidase SppA, 36K type|uniref:signal peptide peptidase SppA n=1 Tax=Pigmentiphaga sp. TaxID=1977564 RepID=UPI0025F8DF27|nr:signal peptide peptidase SppA [Pigmentiphaga sp.]MBX6319833.1 signal peptide peptidase SppA [Pigmentiphaga sp.]